jgi:hypothetical protein
MERDVDADCLWSCRLAVCVAVEAFLPPALRVTVLFNSSCEVLQKFRPRHVPRLTAARYASKRMTAS